MNFYHIHNVNTEAVAWRCSVWKMFSNISQNSQENTCVGASFCIKLQVQGLQLYLKKKKKSNKSFFPGVFYIFLEHLICRNSQVAAPLSNEKNRNNVVVSQAFSFFYLFTVCRHN